MSRYNRENFAEKYIINNINEVDLPINNFNNFNFEGNDSYYNVTESDIQRPDLISYKIYGTTDKWWVIMKYNKISDVWNDLFVGMILEVPSTKNIDDYSRNQK